MFYYAVAILKRAGYVIAPKIAQSGSRISFKQKQGVPDEQAYDRSQIVALLKEVDTGMAVKDLCRKHGIAASTFYKWRSKYGGIEVSDVVRLKELEEENRRLKQVYAELSHKSQIYKHAS